MNERLDNFFINIRSTIIMLIQEKKVDIDCLAFDLGIDKEEFIYNLSRRINNFSFYLQTLSLVENWEG